MDEDRTSADGEPEFLLDVDVNLESPFLHSMLSDQRPVSNDNMSTTTAGTTSEDTINHEPTDEEWENM